MSKKSVALFITLLLGTTGCDSRQQAQSETFDAEGNLEAAADNLAASTGPAEGLEFCRVVERRIAPKDCEDLGRIEAQVTRGAAAFNVPSPMMRDETKSITLVVDRRPPSIIRELDRAAADATDAEADQNQADALTANVADQLDANADMTAGEYSSPASGRYESAGAGRLPSSSRDPTPQQMVEGLEGETATLAPKVGRYMSAELTGDGFKIDALTRRSQEIPPDSQASWQWNVTPLAGGKHSLTLRTVVEGEVSGKRFPLAGTQTVKTVSVDVSWWGKLRDALTAAPSWLKLLAGTLIALASLIFAIHKVRKAMRGDDPEK